jgi:hypothetical protein
MRILFPVIIAAALIGGCSGHTRAFTETNAGVTAYTGAATPTGYAIMVDAGSRAQLAEAQAEYVLAKAHLIQRYPQLVHAGLLRPMGTVNRFGPGGMDRMSPGVVIELYRRDAQRRQDYEALRQDIKSLTGVMYQALFPDAGPQEGE